MQADKLQSNLKEYENNYKLISLWQSSARFIITIIYAYN